MICRLCLYELNKFIPIFDESNCHIETKIAKIITKYLHIELQIDEDGVSNKICNSCWKHLDEFDKFCLHIEEKQKTFQSEFTTNVKCDNFEYNLVPEFSNIQEEDVKNVPLYEQPIDTLSQVQPEFKAEEFAAVSTDEVVSENEDIRMSDGETTGASDNEPKMQSKMSKCKAIKKSIRKRTRTLASKNKNKIQQEIKTSVRNKPSAIKKKREISTVDQTEQLKMDDATDLKCKVCDKILANIVSLKKHMYRCHPSEEALKYSCSLCVKKFAKKYLLDDHILWHRKVKNKNTCEMCKQGFYSKRELKVHRKSEHANELKIICDSCGRSFKCKLGYENHYKAEHLGITRPEEQCKICGKWLKDDRSLYKHMYKHRDESSGKDFICNICGVVKPTKQTLTAHKSYHHPDKMHKCTLCSKEFKRLLALEEHMAVHTGQPLYSCCFCPQTFKSHANMHTHKKRLHPNEWVPKNSQPRKPIASNVNEAAAVQEDTKEIVPDL